MKVFNRLDLEKELSDLNNDRHGIYDKNMTFDTAMLNQSLFYYSDVYILVKGSITVAG